VVEAELQLLRAWRSRDEKGENEKGEALRLV
jgi:hypothetical protein